MSKIPVVTKREHSSQEGTTRKEGPTRRESTPPKRQGITRKEGPTREEGTTKRGTTREESTLRQTSRGHYDESSRNQTQDYSRQERYRNTVNN